jgi:hypothetical protein
VMAGIANANFRRDRTAHSIDYPAAGAMRGRARREFSGSYPPSYSM